MHLNTEQVLWAITLAGHLVLLVVLLGRDRISRYPWFTAAITISALHLLADHLLHGKLATVVFYWQSYSLLLISSLLGAFVVAELARRVFGSGEGGLRLKPNGWIGWTLLTVSVAIVAVVLMGPWPTLESLTSEKELMALRFVWIGALKTELLVGVLAVELTLLLLIFGRRFGFSWKSHPTQIAIGLSTIAISQHVIQTITESIVHSAHPTTKEQYSQILRLLGNLDHARVAVWCVALVWWIIWLWRDEPGKKAGPEAGMLLVPVGSGPGEIPALEAEIPEDQE